MCRVKNGQKDPDRNVTGNAVPISLISSPQQASRSFFVLSGERTGGWPLDQTVRAFQQERAAVYPIPRNACHPYLHVHLADGSRPTLTSPLQKSGALSLLNYLSSLSKYQLVNDASTALAEKLSGNLTEISIHGRVRGISAKNAVGKA